MSRIRLASSVAAVLAVVAAASPTPALVVVRNLNVGNTGLGLIAADAVDVAAGPDDILQFVFDSPNYANDPSDDAVPYRTLLQRRLTTAGVWHGEGRVDTTGDFDGGSTVVPLSDGFGFLWSTNAKPEGTIAYRRLYNIGDPPYGPVRYVTPDPAGSPPAAAAIGDRVMAVWTDTFGAGLDGRVLTANGTILSAIIVDPGMAALADVAAVPGGGFVVSWFDFGTRETKVRPYTPDGFAMAPASVVLANATNIRVAVGDDGIGAVLAGRRTPPESPDVTTLIQRFDATTGTPIGGEIEVVTVDLHGVQPDLGIDLSGNVFVVWGRNDNSAPLGVRARAFDATGAPLGPTVTLSNSLASGRIRTSRIADGTFVTAWVNTFGFPTGNVVSLCDPGTAVCGDGVFVPTCERCDDGAANSDTTPDACRTDCTRPRCGDGVVDGGESCDDGNTVSCDGCSADCAVELGLTCGDGVAAPHGCGETCDDGNGVTGDGCSATCALERIPGGGSTHTDCYAEWRVDNPTNLPLLDTHGHFSAQQACVDDDPQCDFDGGVPGSCTFHVSVCANNVDDPACETPSRLSSWTLDRPSPGQAAKKPVFAAVRAALQSAVPGSIVGPTTTDLCSPAADVVVPLRGAPGTWRPQILKLKSHATLYDGSRDNDGLKLVCLPHP